MPARQGEQVAPGPDEKEAPYLDGPASWTGPGAPAHRTQQREPRAAPRSQPVPAPGAQRPRPPGTLPGNRSRGAAAARRASGAGAAAAPPWRPEDERTGAFGARAPGRGTLSQVLESREQSVSVPRAGAASRVGAWTQVAETAGRRAAGMRRSRSDSRRRAQGRRPAPRGRALGRLSPQPSCLRPGLSRRPSSLTVGPRTTGALSPTRPPGPPGLTSSVHGSRGGGRQ